MQCIFLLNRAHIQRGFFIELNRFYASTQLHQYVEYYMAYNHSFFSI